VLELDEVDIDDEMVREEKTGYVHAFSKGIVWDYFKQVEPTFEKMDAAL
jgi:hypothetical protein